MGTSVIGRITSNLDRQRGPDVQMSLLLPEDWITSGVTLLVDLPRNLACAACEGGGCDACERSGAVSTRGRKDPVEQMEVTLPKPTAADDVPASKGHAIVVRIPDRGGLPPEDSGLPRGNLLLAIRPGFEPSKGVVRLPGPSIPPPPAAPELVSVTPAPLPVPFDRARLVLLLVAIAVVLAIVFRLLGRR